VTVEVEPFLPDLRCRNDIRIDHDANASKTYSALRKEYDLKVMALSAVSNQQALASFKT
jgi:hypothetical protein